MSNSRDQSLYKLHRLKAVHWEFPYAELRGRIILHYYTGKKHYRWTPYTRLKRLFTYETLPQDYTHLRTKLSGLDDSLNPY